LVAEALRGHQSNSNIFSIPRQFLIPLGLKRIVHFHLVILYHDAISFPTQHAITLYMGLCLYISFPLVSLPRLSSRTLFFHPYGRQHFELIYILQHLGSNDKVEAFVFIILKSNLEYCSKQGSSKVHHLVESL
jgi:hypothetical protein